MPGGNKTPNRDLAAVALAAGKPVAEAASAAGVCERTVHNWLSDLAFAARVRQIRGEMVTTAAGRLADGMAAAAAVLVKLLASKREPVRLQAARQLIELGLKVASHAELEARVAALEEAGRRTGAGR
jgi:hypothetical protein